MKNPLNYTPKRNWNSLDKVNQLLKKYEMNITANFLDQDGDQYIQAKIPGISAFKSDQGDTLYKACYFDRIELADKWFSPEVFVLGITQRRDYILASHEVKVECYKKNIHPANYKAPSDDADIMQDLPNPIPVERVEGKKTKKYPNGYQGKLDFYLNQMAHSMGEEQYQYYDAKFKYFLGRQEEWLKNNKTVNI